MGKVSSLTIIKNYTFFLLISISSYLELLELHQLVINCCLFNVHRQIDHACSGPEQLTINTTSGCDRSVKGFDRGVKWRET